MRLALVGPAASHDVAARARALHILSAILALGLISTALGIRLYHIDQPPLEFHATRQYRALLIARSLYFDSAPSVTVQEREVARASRERQGILEPPIFETLTAVGYSLLGGEPTWLPRVVSSVVWLIGAAFVYALGRRIAGPLSGLASVTFYLFLPLAVVASRAFQPDPTMVTLILASLWAIVRHDELPSRRRLVLAAALAAAAFIVLPRSLPVVLTVFASFAIRRHGVLAVRHPDTWIFAGLTLLPVAIVYGYGLASGAFRADVAGAIVFPLLWLTPFLWRGWLVSIESAIGLASLFAAIIGTLLVPAGRGRTLLVASWIGYVLFGLAFNYAIATHDYYHLQLVPIVALAIGPLVALAAGRIIELHRSPVVRAVALGVVIAAVGLSLVATRGRLELPGWQEIVARKQAIGEAVGHSTRTIFLSADYGTPLEYHGLLAGRAWPTASDLEWEGLAGMPSQTAEDRFRSDYAAAAPDYFIVEDMEEYAAQPDLARFLAPFPVVAQTDGYLVIDLRAADDQ
jgi:Dolichyl-phosphate-mannose-protein mannosyltransferase